MTVLRQLATRVTIYLNLLEIKFLLTVIFFGQGLCITTSSLITFNQRPITASIKLIKRQFKRYTLMVFFFCNCHVALLSTAQHFQSPTSKKYYHERRSSAFTHKHQFSGIICYFIIYSKYSLFIFSATIVRQIAHECAYIHNLHTITVPEAKHYPEFVNQILCDLCPINLCKRAVISEPVLYPPRQSLSVCSSDRQLKQFSSSRTRGCVTELQKALCRDCGLKACSILLTVQHRMLGKFTLVFGAPELPLLENVISSVRAAAL